MPARKVRHVALAFPMGVAHLQLVVQGITSYARQHGTWLFTTSPEAATMPVQSLRGWRGDGIIAVLTGRADVAAARSLDVPIVTFSGALRHPGVPRVMVDNHAIGTLAARHLLACGFRRFAYYGLSDVAYADDRGVAFASELARASTGTAAGAGGAVECSTHQAPHAFATRRPWQDEMERLQRWLAALRPPLGVFAANDLRARMIIEACQRLGLSVPDDVGVIGVDDDRVVCEFSDPPLSSISCDWHRLGVEAASMLDHLMRGRRPARTDVRVAPLGVVKRRSTDVIVVDDATVARAVQFVRDNLAQPFGVEALIEHAAVSRRSLELRFKRAVGCTPHEFISRARVARAKDLLGGPNRMKLGDVARACGFRDLRRFRLVFRRTDGVTPGEFRRTAASMLQSTAASPPAPTPPPPPPPPPPPSRGER